MRVQDFSKMFANRCVYFATSTLNDFEHWQIQAAPSCKGFIQGTHISLGTAMKDANENCKNKSFRHRAVPLHVTNPSTRNQSSGRLKFIVHVK